MTYVPTIDPDITVNAVLQQWPESAEVFNALGVDACCGGVASLDAAAREAGIAVDTLLGALTALVQPQNSTTQHLHDARAGTRGTE